MYSGSETSDPSVAAAFINTQLYLIYNWITNNKMKLNLAKSSVMWF